MNQPGPSRGPPPQLASQHTFSVAPPGIHSHAYPPPALGKHRKASLPQPQTFIHHVEEVVPLPPPGLPEHESKRDKRKRETQERNARYAQETWDKREETYATQITRAQEALNTLLSYPPSNPDYLLGVYPLTLERTALLAQIKYDEEYALEAAQRAWEEDRAKIEDEWKKGREAARERMYEGLEDARKKSKEERDSFDIAESGLDGASRTHVTRKLRGRMSPGASSPPPSLSNGLVNGTAEPAAALVLSLPPETNSLSLLAPIPSALPLALSTFITASSRKKPKGSVPGASGNWSLGKSTLVFERRNEGEIEADMMDIRRGIKRKRGVVERGEKERAGRGSADR